MGQCVRICSWLIGTCGVCAALSGDAGTSNTGSSKEEEPAGPSQETPPAW